MLLTRLHRGVLIRLSKCWPTCTPTIRCGWSSDLSRPTPRAGAAKCAADPRSRDKGPSARPGHREHVLQRPEPLLRLSDHGRGMRAGASAWRSRCLTRPSRSSISGAALRVAAGARVLLGPARRSPAVEAEVGGPGPAVRVVHGRAELEQRSRTAPPRSCTASRAGSTWATTARRVDAQRRGARRSRRRLHHGRAPVLPPGRDQRARDPVPPRQLYSRIFPQPEGEGLTDRGRRRAGHGPPRHPGRHLPHAPDSVAETFELLDEIDPAAACPVISTHAGYRFGEQSTCTTARRSSGSPSATA